MKRIAPAMSQHACEILKARHKRRIVHSANTLCCRGAEEAFWPSYKPSSSLLGESKRVSSWQSTSLVSNDGLVFRSSISLALSWMSIQDGENSTNIKTLRACSFAAMLQGQNGTGNLPLHNLSTRSVLRMPMVVA